jgi:hypothetical protein
MENMPSRRAVLKAAGGISVAATVGAASSGTFASAVPKTVSGDKWDALSAELTGELVSPSDANYQNSKMVYLGECSAVNPAGVAFCRTVEDVRTCP